MKCTFEVLCFCIALLCLASSSFADIYKWQDEQGKWHFGDTPPENRKVLPIEVAPSNVVPGTTKSSNWLKESVKSGARKTVTMYSTSWCGYCRQAREYFQHNKIPFIERDIEKSAKAYKEFNRKYGGGGVPLLVVADRTMRGWAAPRFVAFYAPR
mgnify:CR=1 FL=1